MIVAPASIAARQTRATNAGSERVASSHENSTSSTSEAAYATDQRACSTTSCGSRPSFFSMCSALVARKMWMRERPAPASASAAASRSSLHGARERGDGRPADGSRDCADAFEIAGGCAREPGLDDVHAEPLELQGDLRLLVRLQGDARRLLTVAQRRIEDLDPASGHEPLPPWCGCEKTHLCRNQVGVCACKGRVVVCSP